MATSAILLIGFLGLVLGAVMGYYARQSLVKKRKGSIEAKLEKRVEQAKQESVKLLVDARSEATNIVSLAQKEREDRRKELLSTEQLLFKREHLLDGKLSNLEQKEKVFEEKVQKLRQTKERIEGLQKDAEENLAKVSGLTQEQAKEELFKTIETMHQRDLAERLRKLRSEGEDKYQSRAKEIIASAVQRYALSQAQEITTTTLALPSEEVKGRIIGKEGRNIKALEKLTGVEIIVDDSPEAVLISGFNPIRRQVAKVALSRLIKDGRIQPAKIEEQVKKAEEDLEEQMKDFGEKAAYDTGVVNLPSKVIQLLGRLYFRTSYGQNVLLHSIEVAHLAGALAEELGVDSYKARKAGLLHDIGKSVDKQMQGSHIDIGVKILEKFNIEKDIIVAMKGHHDEYETESLDAVLIKTADQISGARPGARKDTVENYINRLKELEDIAKSFSGVTSVYAIQAGREVRVFVKPEEVGDLEAYKLARDIADKIQREQNFPGEIKINLIRETRVIEYAR